MTSKYEPLNQHLNTLSGEYVHMSFRKIEKVLGFGLAKSAYRHRPWWSNNPHNSVITRAWLDAGYRTEQVDMKGEKLVFRRHKDMPPTDSSEEQTPPKTGLARFYGSMKGMITITKGVDLTQPADPDWQKSNPEEQKAEVDMNSNLKKAFEAAMRDIYHRCDTEIGYRPTAFLNMINKMGAIQTAHVLIMKKQPSDGYTRLWEEKRLDLSVEALLCSKPEFHPLFPDAADELVKTARHRLRQFGYNI